MNEQGELTYLPPQLWLTQTLVESNLVVTVNEPNSKRGWNQVFGSAFISLNDIFAVDNCLDVLCNSGVGAYIPAFGGVRETKKWIPK